MRLTFYSIHKKNTMFYSFRVRDNNLSSFTATQKRQVKAFQDFVMKKPDGFCCICLRVLYPEDQHFRNISTEISLPCWDWKLQPLTQPGDESMKMVCKEHIHTLATDFPGLSTVYPGTIAS